jgi:hypothetical protein
MSKTKFHTNTKLGAKLAYNLTFAFWDSRQEDKRFWIEW